MNRNTIFLLPVACLTIFSMIQCRDKAVQHSYPSIFPKGKEIPSSLQSEHNSLLVTLQLIITFGDSTGILATKLLELMDHHFKEEESLVFPQLALLPSLAGNGLPDNSAEIVLLTDKLKEQLAHFSAEHQLIKQYMTELAQVSLENELPQVHEFMQAVENHAASEEEVYFPAAILVGEYLRMKIQQSQN